MKYLDSMNKDDYGRVYFWNHEAEWEAENYEDETRMLLKDEVKYQNLGLIGNDFEDFLTRLRISKA